MLPVVDSEDKDAASVLRLIAMLVIAKYLGLLVQTLRDTSVSSPPHITGERTHAIAPAITLYAHDDDGRLLSEVSAGAGGYHNRVLNGDRSIPFYSFCSDFVCASLLSYIENGYAEDDVLIFNGHGDNFDTDPFIQHEHAVKFGITPLEQSNSKTKSKLGLVF